MVVDLLADVIVYPDHSFKVVDLDELADALNKNLITSGQMQECLENLDHLLKIIYEGKLSDLIMPLELQISRFQSASNATSKPLLL
jgi:predicted RNA-binding protein associated with RNAse of E/G family